MRAHQEQAVGNQRGKVVSLGSIYMPLDRLVKKGLLDSYLSEVTQERGGRHKRIYKLTKDGKKVCLKSGKLKLPCGRTFRSFHWRQNSESGSKL